MQEPLQDEDVDRALQSQIAAWATPTARRFRPTPAVPSRTHVPRADDTSTEQALASRAGARCRGNGTRVRDAGRGNPRSRTHAATGSPAGGGAARPTDRPHRRPPAPTADTSSATQAPGRHDAPARPGLPHAGPSHGDTAGLTANRRPFLYFPLRHHFEQNFHVRHRLERYGAGRGMDFETATPTVIAEAIAEEIGREVDYLPVETNGAAVAAARIAELL